MRFEVLMAVELLRFIFWVIMPCGAPEALKMDTVHYSEALVSTYKSTQQYERAILTNALNS
jgi:hypothetical protein